VKPRIPQRIASILLWLAFALTLGASIQHLAWTFGTIEHIKWLGWLPAIAVDAGMAGIAYGIQQRKRARRAVSAYWLALVAFAGISASANLYHALALEAGGELTVSLLSLLDWLAIAKAVMLSAALPGLAIVLAEIVSADDARESDRLADAERREALKAERLAEAERVKAKAELERSEVTCYDCTPPSVWGSRQARDAHARKHKGKDK